MPFNALHFLVLCAAQLVLGPDARVALLSAAPGQWIAWVVDGADDAPTSDPIADSPEAALHALLARLNAANVAAVDEMSSAREPCLALRRAPAASGQVSA